MTRPASTMATIVLAALIGSVAIPDTSGARSINDTLGKTTFSWLKTMPDAGLSASGECMGARDGTAGLFVHPAAVAGLVQQTAKLSYVAHYLDTQYGSVGYAGRFRDQTIGFKIMYVNYGEFVGTDRQGQRTGTFTAGDMGFSVNVGRELRTDLKIGATASFLTSKLEDFTAHAAAVDLGLLYYPDFEGLVIGAAIQNLGTVTKSYSANYKEVLPLRLTVGAKKKLAHAPITLFGDVVFPNDNDALYAFGLELNIRDMLYLRAGTRSRTRINTEIHKAETDFSGYTTFGMGLSVKRYRFDYAFTPDDMIESTHKITLGIDIP